MGTPTSEPIEQIKRPRISYINPRTLEVKPSEVAGNADALKSVENISPDLIERVVGRMAHVLLDTSTQRVLDANFITNTVKSFDGCINPDEATIQNVKIMVERSFHFFKESKREAPGSFWRLKTSEVHPTKEDVRELIKWFCTDLRSARTRQCYLGIYNPRLNEVYRTRADAIPDDVIAEVERSH